MSINKDSIMNIEEQLYSTYMELVNMITQLEKGISIELNKFEEWKTKTSKLLTKTNEIKFNSLEFLKKIHHYTSDDIPF